MRERSMAGLKIIVAATTLLAPAGPGRAAEEATPWPDSDLGRLEVLAEIETLNGALLASRSATATLEAWCADHHMAQPARISAQRDTGPGKPITPQQRQDLQVGPDEPIKYRRVRLACGDHVLSEADNWYVPSRLTPQMNQVLEATDTPFGKAVQGLHPTRQTLSAQRLWSPLPDGWDLAPPSATTHSIGVGALAIPRQLFQHRAILLDEQRRPFSEVVETYTSAVLDYPRPRK